MGNYNTTYGEEPLSNALNFSDKTIRQGFIRKVYGLLTCQLCLILAVVSAFTFSTNVKMFVARHHILWIVARCTMFLCLIVMACCGEFRRKAPMNFIFLGIFTAAESFLLGMIAAIFQIEEVMIAVGITAVIFFALTLFAFQTKYDFTMMGGVLLVALIVLLVFGLCLTIFGTSKDTVLTYASLGAIIFSIYIIYDTQLMMGRLHEYYYSISPEEYIFATLNLYIDLYFIINIIGKALQITEINFHHASSQFGILWQLKCCNSFSSCLYPSSLNKCFGGFITFCL